ncbi:MAG: MCE family protein [Candidatus Omnitrophica bacterium]|nr:MCE family protein [Candidatus Omnitrophota bacterium]MDE2222381.1 MCE family protein [Candidatus Omnitrophota bacterium]
MEKHNGENAKRLGAALFFIAGLALIAVSVFVIGIDRGLTQPKFQVIVLFNQVGGLVEGSPIRISGVNVGVVGAVDFLSQPVEGRSLKVRMDIYKKYELQFRKCSRVSIRTEGVLGQKLIEISEDHSLKPFDLRAPIIGQDPLDVEDMAAVITRTAISLQGTSQSVQGMLHDWRDVSYKTKSILNRVNQRLMEGSLFKVF